MSFRTAYTDLKNRRRISSPPAYRDPTPEEWKRTMDEYYKRQMAQGGRQR